MRLHVMGAPGSGKSTLADSVSDRYGVHVWDLDFVVYDRQTGRERSSSAIAEELRPVLESESWITEGAYHQGEWLQGLLAAAQLIVWLDFPWRVCAARMAKRHFRLTLAGKNPHPGTWRFLKFLNYTRRAKPRIDTSTQERLSPYMEKVLRCRSRGDVEGVWRRLSDLGRR
jgi:adenylate kinase family enzyme